MIHPITLLLVLLFGQPFILTCKGSKEGGSAHGNSPSTESLDLVDHESISGLIIPDNHSAGSPESEFNKARKLHELELLLDKLGNQTIERFLRLMKDPEVPARTKRDSPAAHAPLGPGTDRLSLGTFNDWYEKSLKDCQDALNSLAPIEELRKSLDDVFYIDAPDGIRIKGDLTFDTLTVEDLSSPDLRTESGISYVTQIDTSYASVGQSLDKIETDILQLKNHLDGALKTHGDQEVHGHLNFDHLHLNCGDYPCDIASIKTETLNGRDVRNLATRVIRLNQDQSLLDHFNFASLVTDNLNADFINSKDPSDIVTTDRDFTIEGDVIFEGPVAVKQLTVPGTVNGNQITRSTVLTTTDAQTITTPVSFTYGVNVQDLNVSGKLSQLGNLDAFLADLYQSGSNQTILGRKTFETLNVNNLQIDGGTVNGFNLLDLQRNLLKREDERPEIVAHVDVDELIIKGDAWVDSINGNKFDDLMVRRDTPTVIRGDKIFTGPVNIRSLAVDGYLNGRKIVDRSLGLLLKTGPQTVTGSKVFRNISVADIALFQGNIGTLNVSQLEDKLKRTIKGGKDRVLTGPVRVDSITVQNGLVNGINLTSLMKDYLKVDQTPLGGRFNLTRAIFNQPLQCDRINGLKFPDDFITLRTDQFFPKEVKFEDDLIITNALNVSQIDDYPVDQTLWDSLSTFGEQFISAPKTINGVLHVKNLQVEKLNSIQMNDLVPLNGNGLILGNKTFTSVKIAGPVSIDTINGVTTVNKIMIHDLFENSITKKGYQTIPSTVHVKKLIIPSDTNIDVFHLNHTRLRDILSSMVRINSNETQVIRGRKRFTQRTTFGNLEFHKTFAGYTWKDFKENYLNSKDSEIQANLTIQGDLIVDNDLIVTGYLNELNIDHLYRQFPVESKPIIINRPAKLRHVRLVGGNIEASSINGIKFGREMISRKFPVTLAGNVHFQHGLIVDNLRIGSRINNVTLSGPVCEPLQRVFAEPYSLTVTGDVTVESDLTSGLVNRRIFNHQALGAVKGVKRFTKLIVRGPVNLSGLLNNFNLTYLNRNYLSRTKNQTINSEVILRNVIFSSRVDIGGHLNGRNVLANGVDLHKLAMSGLTSDGFQVLNGDFNFPGRIVFRKGFFSAPQIQVNRTLIDLTRDAFLKGRPNHINTPTRFNALRADDLTASDRSNLTRSLRRNFERSIESTQFFGVKRFSTLEVDDIEVHSINGIPVSSFLRKDVNGSISGTVVFKGGLEIKDHLAVMGSINGIKLNTLMNKLVLTGASNNTIEAPLILTTKPVVTKLDLPKPWEQGENDTLNEMLIPEKMRSLRRKINLNKVNLQEISAFFEKPSDKRNICQG